MKRSLTIYSVAAMLALGAAIAQADTLNFDTAGGFSGPDATGGNLVFHDITGNAITTIMFQGAPPASLSVPGTYTNVDFGTLAVNTVGTPGVATLSGDQLELVFILNSPTAASAPTFSNFTSGLLTSTAGGLFTLTFAPPTDSTTFTYGNETFTFQLNNEYDVPIDTAGNANFIVRGSVITTAAPEPSSFALMGVAALGLLIPWLRRRLA